MVNSTESEKIGRALNMLEGLNEYAIEKGYNHYIYMEIGKVVEFIDGVVV